VACPGPSSRLIYENQTHSVFTSYPKQFPVRFQPRSDKIVQILREKTAY
jgi:hypothetical protein